MAPSQPGIGSSNFLRIRLDATQLDSTRLAACGVWGDDDTQRKENRHNNKRQRGDPLRASLIRPPLSDHSTRLHQSPHLTALTHCTHSLHCTVRSTPANQQTRTTTHAMSYTPPPRVVLCVPPSPSSSSPLPSYACPMCPDLAPFDSQRALTKHLTMHQRAFDEEEVRNGKGAAKRKYIKKRSGHNSSSSSHRDRSKGDIGSGETKKKKKRNVEVDDEGTISEEERRQSALRQEQKKLNAAAAASGIQLKPDSDEEEDVRCCLCHSAESDEFNPIVMCDGPCGTIRST